MDTDRCCQAKRDPTPGVVVPRPVSDWFGLLLFAAGVVALIVVAVQASNAGGNPSKILRGTDMDGKVCGIDLPDHPLLAWPNPFASDALHFRICVSDCGQTNNRDNQFMAELHDSAQQYYYCVPKTFNDGVNSVISGELGGASRIISDLSVARNLIYGATVGACVMAFLMLGFIRHCANCVFWVTCLVVVAGAVTGGTSLFIQGQRALQTTTQSQLMTWTGVAILVATGIFLLVLCFLRKQLQIALEVVKEASKATSDMKSLVLFPIIPALTGILYFVLLGYVALHVFSIYSDVRVTTPLSVLKSPTGVGNNSNPSTSIEPDFNTDYRNSAYFLFFHMLWTTQFLFYFAFTVIAGAVAEWYFTKTDPSTGEKLRGSEEGQLSHFPVSQSLCRTLVFNLGTVAICAFIIAIIQTLRAIVHFIEKRSGSEPPNALKRAVFCLVKCCLRCVECCCDKVNKNLLIWTAIYGDSFIVAACSSFALIWRNLARVAALSAVSGVILNVGILCTAIFTTGICAVILVSVPYFQTALSSLWLPCVAIFIISYTMAKMFFGVVDAAIDTIFLCFLVDCETNQGNMFASQSLQALVNSHSEDSQAIANDAKARKSDGQPLGTHLLKK